MRPEGQNVSLAIAALAWSGSSLSLKSTSWITWLINSDPFFRRQFFCVEPDRGRSVESEAPRRAEHRSDFGGSDAIYGAGAECAGRNRWGNRS